MSAALSPRQLQTLKLLASGLTRKGAAAHLGLSLETVKTHAEMVLNKLGASTMKEAAAIAAKAGIV